MEPLSACDKEEGPGPGIDVPEAPASGTSLSTFAWEPAIGICPRVEGVPGPGDAARRAVELALLGEPERVVSPRKDEDGMGLACGGGDGLLSLCVKRPAIVVKCARDRRCSESEVWCFCEGWTGLDFFGPKAGRDNDEGRSAETPYQ